MAVLDAAVRQELADAELDAIVDDFKHQGHEITTDVSDGIRAQLAQYGFEDPETTTRTQISTTAAPLKIWNRETGEPSATTSDAIAAKVRIRFPADHPTMPRQRVWSTTPMDPMIVGAYKCYLHSESEHRALMTSLGLPTKPCPAGGLRTQLDVELHLKFKHRRAYDVLMKHREDERHREQMDMMRMQTAAFERMAAAQGQVTMQQTCLDCGWETPIDSKNHAAALRMHRRAKHKEDQGVSSDG